MKRHLSGFTFVEIMVAMLVLTVLALGGAAALYQTQIIIQDQEIRRVAVDQANERLDLVKRTRYAIMRPATPNELYYFVDSDQDDLLDSDEIFTTLATETSTLFPMTTTIVRIPPPSVNDVEYLMINVDVTYGRHNRTVAFDTVIVPDL